MKKDVRIIDGVLKVVKIVDGKIVKVIKDYRKLTEEDIKRRDIKTIGEEEYRKIQAIEDKEHRHEIHYGERYKYQNRRLKKEPDPYRINLLKDRVNEGILDKSILNIRNSEELLDDWARKMEFDNYEEYLNIIALGRGFTCYGEYEKAWMYYPEMPSPIKENRKNTRFLGTYIAENGMAKICEGSQRMKYYNPGYDILCPKGYKIDVKATVLNRYNMFNFHIDRNMIADYFALIVFNNIVELKPLHLWIIGGDEEISGRSIRKIDKLSIINDDRYLCKYRKYEKTDTLEKLANVCKVFDAKSRLEIIDYRIPNKHAILDTIIDIRLAAHEEILPTDILHILEKKKNETIDDTVPIIPDEDTILYPGKH